MNERMLQQLIDSIPELARTGNIEAVNRVLALIENAKPVSTQQPTAGKYLYARVLTLVDGEKHYHPLVGGAYPSTDMEDYKMEAYDNILDLQDSPAAEIANMASRMGYKMQILFVPNDVYANLEKQLAGLVEVVFDAVDEGVTHIAAAAELMGNPMAEAMIKAKALETVMSRPSVAGVGLTATNEIVERADYVDLEVEREEDEEDWYNDCDCDCGCCGDCECCDYFDDYDGTCGLEDEM